MPELPEVEVTRLGLVPELPGRPIEALCFRTPALRHPLPQELPGTLTGGRLLGIRRRGKYLLFDCQPAVPFPHAPFGTLILHLGMSGSLRLVPPETEPRRHDHVDIRFGGERSPVLLRFHDPRRFGTLVWHGGADVENHPLIAVMGIEPLSDAFDGAWLYQATRNRQTPIKTLIMDSHLIVGVGNIYAAESLFAAGIAPTRAAGRISAARCDRLAEAIKTTLRAAIAAGGSSLRDFVHSDGTSGYFQIRCAVYGRTGEPCPRCGAPIRQIRQGGRSTFLCLKCQR